MLIGTNSKKLDISSEKKTQDISERFATFLIKGDIVCLYGEIGVGKTTFIKYLINKLQKNDMCKISEIPSPTFNILNEYKLKNFTIHHYDLYRLKNKQEINDLELIENANNSITLIEWPELLQNYINNFITLKFIYEDNLTKRSLIINSNNMRLINEFS